MEATQKARKVAQIASDHKALNLRILDVSPSCDYAEAFVIVSATSTRHAQGLSDILMREFGKTSSMVEGYARGEWILVDLDGIVVHIFFEPIRAYYNFDKLWSHASLIPLRETRDVSVQASAVSP